MTAPVWLRWLVRGRCRKTIFTTVFHPKASHSYRKQVCHRLRFHLGECDPCS